MLKGKVVLITGSGGLVGSSSVEYFSSFFSTVIGIDNDSRSYFFGDNSSTKGVTSKLEKKYPNYINFNGDIRDKEFIEKIFIDYGTDLELIIHAAAQPSHDWAAREPITDFTINANGTLNVLEAARSNCPKATFIYTSTNKVYGDLPNYLPLQDVGSRFDLDSSHPYFKGIDEEMSIDNSTHSLFGVSKLSADLMVQEYGRYFGMNTTVFRGGCLTGSNHQGAQLHGFLSYIIKCFKHQLPYTIFGYGGKQVRDNIHSEDLVRAFHAVHQNPGKGKVYNIGGGRDNSCSILEVISILENLNNSKFVFDSSNAARVGDHKWYITNNAKFKTDYPTWDIEYSLPNIVLDIWESS